MDAAVYTDRHIKLLEALASRICPASPPNHHHGWLRDYNDEAEIFVL
jgi:hypothetical protein